MSLDPMYTDCLRELEQVKAERDALARDLEAERHHRRAVQESEQRLAAHMERLQARFAPDPWPMEEQPDGSVIPVDPIECFGTPETSLARRDARIAAEALEEAAGMVDVDANRPSHG